MFSTFDSNPSRSSVNRPLRPKPNTVNPKGHASNPPALNLPPNPQPIKRIIKKRRISTSHGDSRLNQAIRHAENLLKEEFQIRCTASQHFPPDISGPTIRSCISKYEDAMSTACERLICCCCGSFVPTGDVYKVADPPAHDLDHCGHHQGLWNLCRFCFTALNKDQIPKFSAANFMNVTMCQDYPSELKDLTPVEECLIAKCHPIGTILKLRPGGHSTPANYHALRGHMIVIPQNPEPLLQILPSPDLKLQNLIKVFWLGNQPPTNQDLKPYLQVRKDKVLAALTYLVRHNQLYRDLTINYDMMEEWPNDFIPSEITDNLTNLPNSDHQEREGYTVSLQSGNYENDFQAAQSEPFPADNNNQLLTGSVYTDINAERVDPQVQMIDALLGLISDSPSQQHETLSPEEDTSQNSQQRNKIPMISYAIRGQATLMSSWEAHHYFTGAFPTLFPKGFGGHLDTRPSKVSLEAFAQWTMNHHSGRFARHNTFMYLLYDVLQLRKSSLGYSLMTKRRNWRSTKDDIASLTVEELQEAAKALGNGQVTGNRRIRRLLGNLTTISTPVAQSFSQKLQMRSKIKALIVRYGMPAFWLTINPADLRNPIVLRLAGVEYGSDVLPTAAAAIRQATATSNPVAVAQFFHHTCKSVIDGLLRSNTSQMGIFGQVSNHFGVVETNGRGMLHLHALVWLSGNVDFCTLRQRLLEDDNFAAKLMHYLESIIVEGVKSPPDVDSNITPADIAPSSQNAETDQEFYVKLADDSDTVARKAQMHSQKHNATCFKYHQKGNAKGTCRFGMPRQIVPNSYVDDYGVVHLARNHSWVNPWNQAIASCIRSNHDIRWIPTVTRSLSLIYYLTNYATKDDLSTQQILLKAALLKDARNKANATLTPNRTDLRLRNENVDQFPLKCYNSLSQDREISGVQVASSLLQLPTYYTANYNFVQVNLWGLRQHVRSAIESKDSLLHASSESIDEEQCVLNNTSKHPINRFDNYKLRGSALADLPFFEYCMLVDIIKVSKDNTGPSDIPFDPKHPNNNTHIQHLVSKLSQIKTVHFNGSLSQFETEEETIPKGHPLTLEIKNDLAEILLGFFLPWEELPSLFQRYASQFETKRDACSKIWNIIEPTLPAHIRHYAQNFNLLRKSREDAKADAAEREFESLGSIEQQCDNDYNDDIDSNEYENEINPLQQEFDIDPLISTSHSIIASWHQEDSKDPFAFPTVNHKRDLQPKSLVAFNISQLPTNSTSGITIFPDTTLEQWQLQLKGSAPTNDIDSVEVEEHTTFEINDLNADLGDGVLHPVLNRTPTVANITDPQSQLGDNLLLQLL